MNDRNPRRATATKLSALRFLPGRLSAPLLSGIVLLVALGTFAPALAHNILVDSTLDDGSPGTLRWAINEANSEGAGVHGIVFDLPANSTINLGSALPLLNNTQATSIDINGSGAPGLTISGNNAARVFFVEAGTVSISNLAIVDGSALGGTGGTGRGGGGGGLGAGGGVFVNNGASVTLQSVRFVDNQAQGGAGGVVNQGVGGGGGGAGMHGMGGTASFAGGGGGGFVGSGGNGGSSGNGGGGGGGQYGNGGNGSFDGGTAGGGGGAQGNGGHGQDFGFDGGGGGGGELPTDNGASGTFSGGGVGAGGGGNGGTTGGAGPTAGATYGGGGGGAWNQAGAAGGAYGGGGGATNMSSGGAGGVFGGGGGGGAYNGTGLGGSGGDFGGGGGSGYFAAGGGDGGYGGGGGGGDFNNTPAGTSAFGGGAGGTVDQGGNGGSAYGGALFVRDGGSLTLIDTEISGGAVAAGAGGSGPTNGQNGQAAGSGAYLHNVTATVRVDTGEIVWADTVAGNGGIDKRGAGALDLAGANPLTGDIVVYEGQLKVNGSVAGNVYNHSVLGGAGTIGGNLENSHILAPGNSIGTLHVSGNFINTGGTFHVEIDDAGNSDRLVVAGTATINGGQVVVLSGAGNFAANTKYTFLTASSISGHFDSITDNLVFLNAILGYDATSAYFTLMSSGANYASIAQTHNEYAFGAYLDQIESIQNSDLQSMLGQLDTLTADEALNAYNQMDGDLHGTMGQVGVQNTTLILYQLNNRLATPLLSDSAFAQTDGYNGASAPVVLVKNTKSPGGLQLVSRRCPPSDCWSGWSFGFGIGGNVQSNGNASGINYGMGGLLAGLERYLSDETLLGFYGGYVGTGVTARDLNQSGSVNGGQFGSYLRRFDGFNHWTVIGGLEFDGYQTSRNIAFGDINTTATANYSGWQGYAYGERGVTFGGPRLMLQPYGALQYVYLRQNGFNEQGAGVMSLDGRGSDANSLRTFVGGRALFAPHRRLSPQLRAAWVHELLSPVSLVNARFGPIGGAAFEVQGLSLGRDWALVGGGLNWQLSQRWSLYGSYDAMVNTRQVLHVGSGGAQYVW